jgi:hypothetical protein
MTKAEVISGLTTLANSHLPSSGEATLEQRARFANEVIIFVQDTVVPDKEAKPNIRF